jgi:hypothetical protein
VEREHLIRVSLRKLVVSEEVPHAEAKGSQWVPTSL